VIYLEKYLEGRVADVVDYLYGILFYVLDVRPCKGIGALDGGREHEITRTKVCPFLAECGKTQGAYFLQ
jgi:hypothetical protein